MNKSKPASIKSGKKIVTKIVTVAGISLLSSLLFALILTNAAPAMIDRVENVTYDWRYLYKYQFSGDLEFPDYGIHIVDIDERSMDRLGSYWGWDRSYQARMVNALTERHPAAIAYDILFYNKEDDIRRERIENVLNDAIRGEEVLENKSEILNERLREAVNYDVQFANAIENSGRVLLGVSMAEERDYRNVTSQIEHRMDMDWHNSLNPASTLIFPDSILQEIRDVKTIIDGIYPENANAAKAIGHLNIIDASTTIRMTQLLYRFADFEPIYLPMSVRIAATLFATPNDEVVFVPNEYIDLGKPFKIFKSNDGEISFSFPDFSEAQFRIIAAESESILALKDGESKHVSAYTALYFDDDGNPALQTRSGKFPHKLTLQLLSSSLQLANMTVGDELELGDGYTVVRDSDIEWEVYDDDESFWLNTADIKTLPFIPHDLFKIDSNVINSNVINSNVINGNKIGNNSTIGDSRTIGDSNNASSTPPRSYIITFDFMVRRREGVLASSIPVLRGAALIDLLNSVSDVGANEFFASIPNGGRRDFGDNMRIPLLRGNRHIVTYFGPASKPFPYFSFYDIMESNLREPMEGRVFIVGSTSPVLFDIKSAPHERVYPAVEIHASILNSIFTNTYVRRLSERGDFALLVVVGLAAALIAFSTKPFLGIVIIAGGLVAYTVFALVMFNNSLLWLELVRPLVTIVLSFTSIMVYRYMTEEKNRKYLQSTFKQYLSPELIDMMYTQKQKPRLGGDEGELTAFFTDIAGFSSFSEKLSPTQLVELLNEYLTAMTDILLANKGTLDKYIGDAIVAFFGAPMFIPNHAYMACHTALAMQEELAKLRVKWRGEEGKWPALVHNMQMRIGINTGVITTGNMGSAMRMNYTMMGDSVNLAARLESAAKYYGVYTMISNYTFDALTKDAAAREGVANDVALLSGQNVAPVSNTIITRKLDVITVAGKTEPVTIYELVCRSENMTDETRAMLEIYNQGVDYYYKRNFQDALACFEKSDPMESNRKNSDSAITPSSRYADMCRKFLENPPSVDWDGVNRLDKK